MSIEQITNIFDQLGFWTWWIAAGLLIILEALAPGAVFLWLGISGAFVGLIAWLNPGLSWEIQTSLFAVLSVVSIVVWRKFMKTRPTVPGNTRNTGKKRPTKGNKNLMDYLNPKQTTRRKNGFV